MTRNATPDWLAACRLYLSTVAILHFGWEWLQLPLYTVWRDGTWREIAFAVIHCTAGDAVIAGVTLLGALAVFANGAWPRERFAPVA